MSIAQILFLILIAIFCGLVRDSRYRSTLIIISSVLLYYRLQPASPIRFLDFWFPTFAFCLGLLVWSSTQENFSWRLKENLNLLILFPLLIAGVSANRYLAVCCITVTDPPHLWVVILFLALLIFVPAIVLSRFVLYRRVTLLIFIFLALFVALKAPTISTLLSKFLRIIHQQDPRFSSSSDIVWVGISYILLRLLHLLIDIRHGRLQTPKLSDTLTYLFFFPSLLAGPIAQFPYFRDQLNKFPQSQDFVEGMRRIFVGLFRKFVVADSLALLALSPQNALQIQSPIYLWIALVAYSLRIYFDFCGYTDIAIGSARLMGISLPENFNAPYLKTSLIQFWNSWHITLADWFRGYVFNPLTRKLRTSHLPSWITIFLPQLTTMLLIGLWHGITLNFLAWGVWHGVGLFINNRWNARCKPHPLKMPLFFQNVLGWMLSFSYVTLGWVWFLMPKVSDSFVIFQKLFGFGV